MIAILKNHLQYKMQILDHLLATFAAIYSRLSFLFISFINIQLMSPEEFGVFALLMLITNMISAFVSGGGDLWLNRFSRYYHVEKKQIPMVSIFYLKFSLI